MNRKERFIPSDIPIIIATILIIIFTLYPVIYVVSMSFSGHPMCGRMLSSAEGFSLGLPGFWTSHSTASFYHRYTVVACSVTLKQQQPLFCQKTFLPAQTAVSADDADDVYQRRSGALYPGENASVNTRWAIVLPVISASALIITRSFLNPSGRDGEAVKIDGGSEWTVMTRIFIHQTIISVLILFYGVGYGTVISH
ncbi:MAG: hypothetical protein ACLVAW_29320 [Eisenbergiella massiliensis]